MSAAKRLDESDVEITDDDIKKALKRPSDFGYSGSANDGMFQTWSLGPVIEHRDSGILDKANAKALIDFLGKDPTLADDWKITDCSHWAVGWVHHISFRVVEDDGKTPTRIFRVLTAWWKALDSYPVADEDLYSEMENDASWKWVSEEGPRVASRHDYVLPEGWQEKVDSWWSENDQSALESVDDQGASPSEDQYLAAFEALGFAKEE